MDNLLALAESIHELPKERYSLRLANMLYPGSYKEDFKFSFNTFEELSVSIQAEDLFRSDKYVFIEITDHQEGKVYVFGDLPKNLFTLE